MKNFIGGLAAALCLLISAQASQSVSPENVSNGVPGVEDGSCWKNSNHEIEVEVRGTIHGDQEVTVTEGSEEGTGTGTPDPDGGCAESSSISVGDETYRVHNGKMQWKNESGDWINMTKTNCPKTLGDTRVV